MRQVKSIEVDWGYVAGFWDGEGWVSFNKSHDGYGSPYWNIGACQSTPQDECLKRIQDFLWRQGITSKIHIALPNGPRRHPVSKLYINGDRENKINFLDFLVERSIVKRTKALECRRLLQTLPYKKVSVRTHKLAYLDYWKNGMGKLAASRKHKIGVPTLNKYILDNGLPSRTLEQSLSLGWKLLRRRKA